MAIAACGPQTFDVNIADVTAAPSPSPAEFEGVPLYGTGTDGTLTVGSGTSKVINICHELNALINDTMLDVSSTLGYADGQVLLLLQERDRSGVMPQPGKAGLFELVRIADVVDGITVRTRFPVVHAYEGVSGASAQACTVPEYSTVVLDGGAALDAPPRDPFGGGILAFLVSSSMDAGAAFLLADDLGFPGGACNSNAAADESVDANNLQGGGKGQGFGGIGGSGFGNNTNGGGGGNPREAGGGGGGAARAGGRGGGRSSDNDLSFGEPGDGYAGLSTGDRLFFGGGGGGGHGFNGTENPPCDGGAGGGILFIQARLARGDGAQIRAAGASLAGGESADSGGGGGGGGGGTVWLIVGTGGDFHPNQVSVAGGRGGNSGFDITEGTAGPGGGGGGGYARVGGITGYDLLKSGGPSGVVVDLTGESDNTRGATVGSNGTTF